jgi:DNA-binding beta-propeller fold protein YncE
VRAHRSRPVVVLVALWLLVLPFFLGPRSWAKPANRETLPARAIAQAQAGHAAAVGVRSHLTADWGLNHPTGLTYLPDEGFFLVARSDGQDTKLLRLSPHEKSLGTLRLRGMSHPVSLAFDHTNARLTALSGTDFLSVSASEIRDPQARISRTNVANLGLQNPTGATFDPVTGTWFVLDDGAKAILRIPPSWGSTGISGRISLEGLGASILRGLALNPADGLLYVAAPTKNLLYGVDTSGKLQRTHSLRNAELGGRGLQDPRALVFAPSSDPTDDAAIQHLFIADAGGSFSPGGVVELSLPESQTTSSPTLTPAETTAPRERGSLVQTIRMSRLKPPSPDPAGIVYRPGADRLLVSDSEVNEMAIFDGVNLFELTREGSLRRKGVTTDYSKEPTGLGFNPAERTLFVSSDDQRLIFLVRSGRDRRFGTSDDRVVRSIDVSKFRFPVDAEGVEYDTISGQVFIVDGVGREVWRVDPGPNRTFGNRDDVVSHFDVKRFGAGDPEGIAHVAFRDNLLVIDDDAESVYEVTTGGALVRTIDLSDVPGIKTLSGISLAPGSDAPSRMNLWVVDRGVDNGTDPRENDGKLFEISWPSAPPTATTLEKRIATSAGDAEEKLSTGTVVTKQKGLDLIRNRRRHRQIIGLRFNEVNVPSGAAVVNAYIQFEARKTTSRETNLTLRGEDSDHARRFTTARLDISSRPRTTASAQWSPPPWKAGQAGGKQRTPDLSAVLQEIFNRPGWASKNALALTISGKKGRRVAEAFDGGKAPVLHVEFARTKPSGGG